jgi:hypothetical protein
MKRSLATPLGTALSCVLIAMAPAVAQQDVPRPAPGPYTGGPVKPVKPVNPTQGGPVRTGQVVVGIIHQIDPKTWSIAVRPMQQGTQIQYQGPIKPHQGQKSGDDLMIVVVSDQTAIQAPEAKGTPGQEPVQGTKIEEKPTPTPIDQTQGGKVKEKPTPAPIDQTQGGKVKEKPTPTPIDQTQGDKVKEKPTPTPIDQTQGGKVKPGPGLSQYEPRPGGPTQQQFAQFRVGQTVRVVYQQQDGKMHASQVRVLQNPQEPPSGVVAPVPPSAAPSGVVAPPPPPAPTPGPGAAGSR